MAKANENLLTAAQIAEKLGLPTGKVTKLINDRGFQADTKKGACNLYSSATVKKIQKSLKSEK
jgi:hypothetical protein